MKRFLPGVLLALCLLSMSCGGGDDGGGPAGPGNGGGGGGGGGGGNSFTATIDGVSWKSDTALIQVSGSASATREGTLIISGYQASTGRSLQLILSFIIGPASQPLGVNIATTPGGSASVLIGSDIWLTPLSGQAGFVTITARTDKRVAGTFNFTGEANPGTVPLTRTVTNGAFDITIDAGLPPLPTGVGSTSTATLGGTPWNAATIVGLRPGPGVFSISTASNPSSSSTGYSMVLSTAVPITTADSYGIGSEIQLQIVETGTANGWAAVAGPDVGTLTITYLADDRVIGTFSGTIPNAGGGTALTVVNGTINAYLQN